MVERYLYQLPTEDGVSAKDGELVLTSLTTADVKHLVRYAVADNTNEVPSNSPRKIRMAGRGIQKQELQFKGFTLTKELPRMSVSFPTTLPSSAVTSKPGPTAKS